MSNETESPKRREVYLGDGLYASGNNIFEFTFKLADQSPNAIPQKIKCTDDWFRLHNPRFMERYMERLIGFHVHFISRESTKRYCATFQRPTSDAMPHAFENKSDIDETNNRVQETMFINDVQIVDAPESFNGPTSTMSVVRLRLLNDCLGEFAGSLYFSSSFGFVYLPVMVDRKLGTGPNLGNFGVSLTSPPNQLPKQLIQAGSKMINNIASDNTETVEGGTVFNNRLSDAVGWLRKITVQISNDSIFVSFKENGKFCGQLLDILIGPTNFGFNGFRN